ncbi:MAG: hypothetical protein WCV83_00310 [Candidatus Magasanikbacteria bacterium]
MKNYASNRAQKGKTAFRTPSMYKANKAIAINKYRAYDKGLSSSLENLKQIKNYE